MQNKSFIMCDNYIKWYKLQTVNKLQLMNCTNKNIA